MNNKQFLLNLQSLSNKNKPNLNEFYGVSVPTEQKKKREKPPVIPFEPPPEPTTPVEYKTVSTFDPSSGGVMSPDMSAADVAAAQKDAVNTFVSRAQSGEITPEQAANAISQLGKRSEDITAERKQQKQSDAVESGAHAMLDIVGFVPTPVGAVFKGAKAASLAAKGAQAVANTSKLAKVASAAGKVSVGTAADIAHAGTYAAKGDYGKAGEQLLYGVAAPIAIGRLLNASPAIAKATGEVIAPGGAKAVEKLLDTKIAKKIGEKLTDLDAGGMAAGGAAGMYAAPEGAGIPTQLTYGFLGSLGGGVAAKQAQNLPGIGKYLSSPVGNVGSVAKQDFAAAGKAVESGTKTVRDITQRVKEEMPTLSQIKGSVDLSGGKKAFANTLLAGKLALTPAPKPIDVPMQKTAQLDVGARDVGSAKPQTKAPETRAPETRAPETRAPETRAPETKTPDQVKAETKVPETRATETKAPDQSRAETKTSDTKAETKGESKGESKAESKAETKAKGGPVASPLDIFKRTGIGSKASFAGIENTNFIDPRSAVFQQVRGEPQRGYEIPRPVGKRNQSQFVVSESNLKNLTKMYILEKIKKN